ncbi:MAG: hypothetical protein ACLUAL_04410 [Blautia wexlerae]|nr:hypothetical protein [Blautia wexlerae]
MQKQQITADAYDPVNDAQSQNCFGLFLKGNYNIEKNRSDQWQ